MVSSPSNDEALPTSTQVPDVTGIAIVKETGVVPLLSLPTEPLSEPLEGLTEKSDGSSTKPSLVGDEHKIESSRELKDVEAGTDLPGATEKDPNIVDFDGPDDPAKAINWPRSRKWATIAVLSAMTFVSPLASSMFAPGVPQVMEDFHSTNILLASFVVSVYVLGYALGPMFFAPISEMYGRLPVYHATNILFIVFTVACALSTNLNMLIGFRFLEGVAGSASVSMGGGTVADLFIQQERGTAMAVWSMGPLIGPVVGPVAGGFLNQAKGWRWIFWVIAMAAGLVSVSFVIILRETYSYSILDAKTKRLRKETGNQKLRSAMDRGLTPAALFKISIVRPLKMLLFSPIISIMCFYMAFVYGILYLLFTTITEVFEGLYGFSSGIVGLTFIGIGIGMFVGLFIFGAASDRYLKKKSAAGEMKPEYRLPPMIPATFAVPIGLILYGWSADKDTFWFVPILGTTLVGFGLMGSFMPVSTYLVDSFPIYAASAMAASTIFRSLFGALLPLAGRPMYASLGLGWGNTLLAFIALALAPVPFFLIKRGEWLRKHPRFQLNL